MPLIIIEKCTKMLARKDGKDNYVYGQKEIKSNYQKVYCNMGFAIPSKEKWKLKFKYGKVYLVFCK